MLTDSERVKLLDDALRGARRGAIGRFASSLSHALGTPLNVIAGRAAMIGMNEGESAEAHENARIIEAQVKNITDMLQRALEFVRDGAPGTERLNLSELAQRVAGILEPLAVSRGVAIEVDNGKPVVVSAIPARVFDIALTLTSWAVGSAPRGRKVRISVDSRTVEPPSSERGRARGGPSAVIEVRCPGADLSPELVEHVYEPWLSGSSVDRDTALTLAVAYGIAREHRGFVQAERADDGVTFRLCWPV